MKKIIKKIRKIFKMQKKVINTLKKIKYMNYYKNCKIEKNTVLIESKNGSDLASNMFYILKETVEKHPDKRIFIVVNEKSKHLISQKLNFYNLNKNIEFIKRNSFNYYKKLTTVEYIFVDTSLARMYIKKSSQTLVNTWHGTPLKMMGKDVDRRVYGIGNVQKNHFIADYLVYPNEFMKEKMTTAYCINEFYQGKYICEGYPRNDIFFNKTREKEVREELELTDKEIFVYMPTWRGILTEKENEKQINELDNYLREIDTKLKDNQILYVKLHVFVNEKLNLSKYKHIKPFPSAYETYDFLNIADCLITDYSSVFFDYANSKKKIVLFVYDKEQYLKDRGLYLSLDELPFPQVTTVSELITELNTPKKYDDKEFLKKYCTYDKKNSTELICNYIYNNKGKLNIKKETRNKNKENVLIYIPALAKNGITSSLFNLLNSIDTKKRNYILTFSERKAGRYLDNLNILCSRFSYIPINDRSVYSFKELIAYILFYKLNISNAFTKKHLDTLYKTMLKKCYGNIKFDYVIHFSGYERKIIGLFQRFDCTRVIFSHSIMEGELKHKTNQHYLTLKEAYRDYDIVAGVSEDSKNDIIKISGRKDNAIVIQNSFNYKELIEKSKQEIIFDEKTTSNIELDELKKILDQKADKFINIGRFSVEKGHFRLIDAFSRYNQKFPESYLIIIGGYGKLYKKTLEYAEKQPCKDKIIIIRNISNPIAILKKCSLFVFSSFYEGQGLVLYEAAGCDVPCISTRIEGAMQILKDHQDNLVDNSEEGIYDGMIKYKENKIKKVKIDFEKYNNESIRQFEQIFNKKKGDKK